MHRLFFITLLLLASCGPIEPIENPFDRAAASPSPVQEISKSGTEGRENELRILVIDVGQGDATLVIGPGTSGKRILIDAGRPGEGTAHLLPTLDSQGINRLDWIVATHYDADHIGGISEVLKGKDQRLGTDDDRIPSSGVLDRGDFSDKSTPVYSQYVREVGPYRQEATPGMEFELGDGAKARVVVVNGRYTDGRRVHLNPDEENEACIGLLIQYGTFRYFTAGDLTGGGTTGGIETKDMETIAGEIIGDIDILHLGHHGSENSTHGTFLAKIKPEAVVISVGRNNDYHHPARSVLKRLETARTKVHRTDQSGTLEIRTDGKSYKVTPLSH